MDSFSNNRSSPSPFLPVEALMQIIHIQQQHVSVLQVAHATEITRRLSHSMSPGRWTFSGVATGENASFPSATYLRKKYKKLQRRIVSRCSNPSFQAIRALNGQPGARQNPVVVHAIIKDSDGSIVGTGLSAASTPEKVNDTQERLASSSRDPQSCSTRIDRLVKAVHRQQRIRYEPPEGGENVDVLVSSPHGSETGSPRSVTDQIAALPNIFGRIISPRCGTIAQSPDSSRSDDSFFYPTCSGPQNPSVQASSSATTSPALSNGGTTSVRVGPRIITETQRRDLEQRILDKIAASVGNSPNASSGTAVRRGNSANSAGKMHFSKNKKEDNGSDTTDSGYYPFDPVDPKQLVAIGKNGENKCHTISPIRLDYHKGRGFKTPSLGSSESCSEFSSPLDHRSKTIPFEAGQIGRSDDSFNYTSTVATTTDAWDPEDSQSPSSERGNFQVELEKKAERVFSWLHRVEDAIVESDGSPTKKFGKAVNVFREGPHKIVGESPQKATPGSAMALKDVTNLRRPGYLLKNSFTQEKVRREKLLVKSKSQKQRIATTQTSALPHEFVVPTHTTASSEELSGPSTVMKSAGDEEQDLHPEVAYSLARLEGRMPPRPSSPFPIRRSSSPYGADVDVEIPPPDLTTPQPMRPDHEEVVGNWSAHMEEAVQAGFQCVLEPPLSEQSRTSSSE
ncbi:MAG: hypothetical protein Q9226_000914 [Calogaya cf. arnoldii]